MAKSLFKVTREGQTAGFEVLETSGAVTVLLDGTQILAEQQAAVDDATDAATAITSINAVIDALEAHGLLTANGQ
jgi:hypothetical protein